MGYRLPCRAHECISTWCHVTGALVVQFVLILYCKLFLMVLNGPSHCCWPWHCTPRSFFGHVHSRAMVLGGECRCVGASATSQKARVRCDVN